MSERARNRVHTQDSANVWLLEIEPEPTVKINPMDAETRTIQNGDYVEVFNNRGRAVAKAVLSSGIRPGVLVYPKGWQASQFKAGSWTELLTDEFESIAVNMSFFDNAVEARKWNEEV
jgi:anaerobic selenocysteine-containing dehydrogenase